MPVFEPTLSGVSNPSYTDGQEVYREAEENMPLMNYKYRWLERYKTGLM